MNTLYLHIGSPKTATTSIQKYLEKNRKVLTRHDYCYPKLLHKYPYISSSRNGHFLTGEVQGSKGNHDYALEEQYLNEGLAQVAKLFEKHHHVILSDEILWRDIFWRQDSEFPPKNAFPILLEHSKTHGYQVKVIVYLRRQDDFIASFWNQKVKKIGRNFNKSYTATLDEYIPWAMSHEDYILGYGARLDYMAQIFGAENLIVRRFDPKSWVNGSIIDDFMHCVGLEITEDFIPLEIMTNPGLNENTTEIKRILNKKQVTSFSTDEMTYLRSVLFTVSSEAADRPACSQLSPEKRRELMAHFAADNKHIASKYVRDGQPLFSDTSKDCPAWTPDNPYMLEDVISFFAEITMDQRREIEQLQKTIARDEQELRKLKDALRHPFRTLFRKIFRRKK